MNLVQSSRFKDAVWFPKEKTYCIVGGSGGIGSWLTLMLARAGFSPIVYDFDNIEEHNIGGQLFTKQDAEANKPKVEAVKEICKNFADADIMINNEKYTRDSMSHNYVFSAFDNMQARKDMFEAWKEHVHDWKDFNSVKEEEDKDRNIPIFIDGRLLMEQLTIFCVTPENMEEYEQYLFDDKDVPPEPCTLKQTSHSAAMIASHMVGFFTNHFGNNIIGEKDRTVPFKWEYFIPIDYLNEEINPILKENEQLSYN